MGPLVESSLITLFTAFEALGFGNTRVAVVEWIARKVTNARHTSSLGPHGGERAEILSIGTRRS